MKTVMKMIGILVSTVIIVGLALFIKDYTNPENEQNDPKVIELGQFLTKNIDLHPIKSGEKNDGIILKNGIDPQYHRLAKNGGIAFNVDGKNEKTIKDNINKNVLTIAREVKKLDITINTITLYVFHDDKKIAEIIISTAGVDNMAKKADIALDEVPNYCFDYKLF